MNEWSERPPELAYLLNPAFCALVIRDAVKASTNKENGFPFSLSFLVLPIILHKRTRDLLPKKSNSILHSWLQENPEVKIGFSDRVKRINPFTKEAILFGSKARILNLTNEGNLISIGRVKSVPHAPDLEIAVIRKKAGLLGKWLIAQTNTQSVFTFWGIAP